MDPIVLVKDAASCCGCGACLTVCPKQAITMEEDAYGCRYPKIDPDKCVHCGKCVKICQYAAPTGGNVPLAVYAAVGKCAQMVRNSASGGIFASLAKSCAQKGGLASGAVLDCENSRADVYHMLSCQESDLRRMQGSKYVQSEAWRSYPDVTEALKAGKTVLFSGTPCQVAAIKALTGDPENLVTVDVVCHGVPPLKMLNDYLGVLSGYLQGEIRDFRFRDKACQKQYAARIDTDNHGKSKRVYLKSSLLSFYAYFLKGTFFRENCYSCPYAGINRVSDITIGDYWGIEQFHGGQFRSGEMPRRNDWSCVLVNTSKGEAFLRDHGEALMLYPSRLEWVVQKNQQLKEPVKRPKNRDFQRKLYKESGYRAVEAAFVQENGGKLRFGLRMIRDILENSRMVKKHEN